MPVLPFASTQVMLALTNAARRCHEQRKPKVRRGFGQHIRRIRALHTGRRHGRHIEVVVAHGHIGNDLQLRAGRQQLRIDLLRACGQHAVLALQLGSKFLRRPDDIVLIGLNFKVLLQALHDLGRDGTRNQNARLVIHSFLSFAASCPCPSTGRGRLIKTR